MYEVCKNIPYSTKSHENKQKSEDAALPPEARHLRKKLKKRFVLTFKLGGFEFQIRDFMKMSVYYRFEPPALLFSLIALVYSLFKDITITIMIIISKREDLSPAWICYFFKNYIFVFLFSSLIPNCFLSE